MGEGLYKCRVYCYQVSAFEFICQCISYNSQEVGTGDLLGDFIHSDRKYIDGADLMHVSKTLVRFFQSFVSLYFETL